MLFHLGALVKIWTLRVTWPYFDTGIVWERCWMPQMSWTWLKTPKQPKRYFSNSTWLRILFYLLIFHLCHFKYSFLFSISPILPGPSSPGFLQYAFKCEVLTCRCTVSCVCVSTVISGYMPWFEWLNDTLFRIFGL